MTGLPFISSSDDAYFRGSRPIAKPASDTSTNLHIPCRFPRSCRKLLSVMVRQAASDESFSRTFRPMVGETRTNAVSRFRCSCSPYTIVKAENGAARMKFCRRCHMSCAAHAQCTAHFQAAVESVPLTLKLRRREVLKAGEAWVPYRRRYHLFLMGRKRCPV